MKTLQRRLLIAGLTVALGLGAVARAQTPPDRLGDRPDPAPMEQRRARMHERMAQHLAELKQKLQLAPGQEAAWTTWTATMKPAPHQRPDRAEFEKLTTPERIDRMRALRAERNAEMDRRMDATKSFYAQLSAEQKTVFDAESLRFLRGRAGSGMGHRRRG